MKKSRLNSSEHALQVKLFPGLHCNYGSWAGRGGQRGLVIIGDGQADVGRGV